MYMEFSFKHFVEEKKAEKPANYIDTLWQELGVDRNSLPDFIESGPIQIDDEGLTYNQAIWQIIKPIGEKDMYARIKLYKSKSPNFERAYIKGPDGKLVPYQGEVEGKVHLITLKKLAEILGKGWQSAAGAAGGGIT